MERAEFISLIGTNTLVDYPHGWENQIWSMENFSYDEETDTIHHNRLDLIVEVLIAHSVNPRIGNKSEATHG